MTIPLPTPCRIALMALLLVGLVMLTDSVARFELAQAVDTSMTSVRLVAVVGG